MKSVTDFEQLHQLTEVRSAAPQRNSVVFTSANKSAKGGSSKASVKSNGQLVIEPLATWATLAMV